MQCFSRRSVEEVMAETESKPCMTSSATSARSLAVSARMGSNRQAGSRWRERKRRVRPEEEEEEEEGEEEEEEEEEEDEE